MTGLRARKDGIGTHLQSLAACLRGEPPEDTDWDEVIRLANEHWLGPRLHRSLAAAHPPPADREAMEYLAGLDAANRARNARLLGQLEELTRALAAEGIAPLVLKGGAELVRGTPRGAAPRMLRDLDILIRPEEAARTDAILRACGYDTFPEDPGAHSAGSYFRPTDVGAVDVHLGLPLLFAPLVTPKELRQRTEALPVGGTLLRVPDPSLQFVVNLGHEMLHDEAVVSGFVDLRYLVELIDLAGDASAPLDWAWILGKCDSRKFRLGLELQARMARHLGLGDFPVLRDTLLGRLLHRRRLFKLAHPWLGDAEWQAVRRAKDLRHLGERRSDQTGSVAAS